MLPRTSALLGSAVVAAALLISSGVSTAAVAVESDVVEIPDDNLRSCLLREIQADRLNFDEIPPDSAITKEFLTTVTVINCEGSGVSELTGLEHASNLTQLYLRSDSKGEITDMTPLQNLTNLELLQLPGHRISDLNTLGTHEKLWNLDLSNNEISDLDGIESAPNVMDLDLSGNHISDISPLTRLTHFGTPEMFRLTLYSQTLTIEDVRVGDTAPNPVRDQNGDPVPITTIESVVDGPSHSVLADGRIEITQEGEYALQWKDPVEHESGPNTDDREIFFDFSGTITIQADPAPPSPLPWILGIGAAAAIVALYLRKRRKNTTTAPAITQS